MTETKPKTRRRSIKREGTFAHYLVYLYETGRNWTPRIRSEYSQIHVTERNNGIFVRTQADGAPEFLPAFLDALDGVEWVLISAALHRLKDDEPDYHQAIEIVRNAALRRASMADAAKDHGIPLQTLSWRFWEGVDLAKTYLRGEQG